MNTFHTTTVFGRKRNEKDFRPLWCFLWETEEEKADKTAYCKKDLFKGFSLKFEDRTFNV